MPDYGHAGRPSTYLAVAGNSHRHTSQPSSSCFRLFPSCECKNPDVQLIAARDFDQVARHPVRGTPIFKSTKVVGCRFSRFQQITDPRANASRQNGKNASGKTGAAFCFWETDDDDRAHLRHLIEIREQFDLIMVGAEDVGLE